MFNPRSNSPFGRGGPFGGSRYQYQTASPYGYAVGTPAQTSSLISKAMGLLAFSFLCALLGTFLEGLALSPIISLYLGAGYGYILSEAFLITAVTSLGLSVYAWTTKRDFSRLADYLFFGLLLLIVAGIVGIFFGGIFSIPLVGLFISIFGVAIFSGYVLYYVQRARYMADTLPNAIGITVSLFITVMNLFLYILELLTILQGGGRRR